MLDGSARKGSQSEPSLAKQTAPLSPKAVDEGEGLELVFEEFLAQRATKFFGEDDDAGNGDDDDDVGDHTMPQPA